MEVKPQLPANVRKALLALLSAEIDSAMGHRKSAAVQISQKMASRLISDGLAYETLDCIGQDRLGKIEVIGLVLSHKGRMLIGEA